MTNKWVVTPSLRVATFSHYNKMGEDVLVETDLRCVAPRVETTNDTCLAARRA
jgi:hypothetical protein